MTGEVIPASFQLHCGYDIIQSYCCPLCTCLPCVSTVRFVDHSAPLCVSTVIGLLITLHFLGYPPLVFLPTLHLLLHPPLGLLTTVHPPPTTPTPTPTTLGYPPLLVRFVDHSAPLCVSTVGFVDHSASRRLSTVRSYPQALSSHKILR